MPLQNRVTPLGELVADPARGLVYGNRGCLHDAEGHIRRVYQVRRWIACRLEFRGRRRSPLQRPGRFTELFFLDEATAFAAGHRPCAECRRADYDRFSAIWRGVHDESGAEVIDARLHDERIDPAARDAPPPRRRLPRGCPTAPSCSTRARRSSSWATRSARWSLRRLRPGQAAPVGNATLITPPSLVEVLRAGWYARAPRRRRCRSSIPRPTASTERPGGRVPPPLVPLRRGIDRADGVHGLAHRPLGRRQDDDRPRRGGRARAPRPPRRGARRRRRPDAPLERPRLLARGPRHEHRADRLGRVAAHASRCGGGRRRHLAVRHDAQTRARARGGAGPVRRGVGEGAGRGVRTARREGPLRKGVRRRDHAVHRSRRPVRGAGRRGDRRRHVSRCSRRSRSPS